MNRYYIGHGIVAALGFLMGAVLAMLIAPGNALLITGTGIGFGFFACALLDRAFGGDWFWPFGRTAGKKPLAAQPSVGHR